MVTIYRILPMVLRSAVHDRLLAASPCHKIKLPALPLRRLQVRSGAWPTLLGLTDEPHLRR